MVVSSVISDAKAIIYIFFTFTFYIHFCGEMTPGYTNVNPTLIELGASSKFWSSNFQPILQDSF